MKADKRKTKEFGRNDYPPLPMTQLAASRLGAYAMLADDDEFMVILLGKKTAKNKDTVADVYLLHDQKVGGASVNVSGHGINKSLWEIQEKYPENTWEILGWGHGHGHHHVFHSHIDDENTEEVFLEQLAPIRMVVRQRVSRLDLTPDENGRYILSEEHGSSLKLLNVKPSGILRIEKRSPCYSGWIYSLVTNAEHAYYAERFSKNWCAGCDSVTTTRSRMNVQLLQDDTLLPLDHADLRKEFNDKVKRSFFMGFSCWPTTESWRSDSHRNSGENYPLVHDRRYESDSNSTSGGSPSTPKEEQWKD